MPADNSASVAAFIKTFLALSEKGTEVVDFGWRSMRFPVSSLQDWKRAHAIEGWFIQKAFYILLSSDCCGNNNNNVKKWSQLYAVKM